MKIGNRHFWVSVIALASLLSATATAIASDAGSGRSGGVLVAKPGIDPELDALAQGFSAWLELRLAGAGLEIVERASVGAASPEGRGDALSPRQSLELGRRLGARFVVFPNLRRTTGQVEARLRVIDTASGGLLAATLATAPLAIVGEACDRAAVDALAGMGVEARPGPPPLLEELAASGRALSLIDQGRLHAAWLEVEGKLSTTTSAVRARIERDVLTSRARTIERARVLAASGKAKEGWSLIHDDVKRALANEASDPGLLLAAAEIELAQSNPRGARRFVETMIERGRDDGETQRIYARVLLDQRDAAGARKALERAILLDPNDPWSFEQLATLESSDRKRRAEWLLEAGRREAVRLNSHRARRLLDRAGRTEPGLAAVTWRSLGEFDRKLGRPAEALTAYRSAVAAGGDDAATLTGIGAAQHALGDAEAAEASLEAALALEPNHPGALTELGAMRLEGRRPAEAVTLLKRAVDATPDVPEPRRNLAQALRATGDLEGALEHLEQVSRQGKASLEDLRLTAALHSQLGKHERARDVLIQATRLEPFDPDLQRELGRAYSASGDEEGAAKANELAATLSRGADVSATAAAAENFTGKREFAESNGPNFDPVIESFASQTRDAHERRVARLALRDRDDWRSRLFSWLHPREPDRELIARSLDASLGRAFDLAPEREIENPILAEQLTRLYDFDVRDSLDAELVARATNSLAVDAILVARFDRNPDEGEGACGDARDRYEVELRLLSGRHADVVTILANTLCVEAGLDQAGRWNRRALGAYAAIAALLFFPLIRGWGRIEVTIELPPKTKGFFGIRISKRADDVPTQKSKGAGAGRLRTSLRAFSRFEKNMVGRKTLFRWIPARKRAYHVTVKGPLMDASGENIIGHFLETQKVRVMRGNRPTAKLEYDFRPKESAVSIDVRYGDTPVENARLAIRGQVESVRYARTGNTIIPLGLGTHHLLVGSEDRVAEATVTIESLGRSSQVRVQLADEQTLVFKNCPDAVDPFLAGDYLTAADALDAQGQSNEAHLVRASFHEQMGATALAAAELEAAGQFEEAARLRAEDDDDAGSALLFEKAGDHAQAAAAYRAAGELADAARCYEASYDYQNALECYRESGDDPRALEILEKTGEYFEAGCLASELGDPDRALANLQQIETRDQNYAEACKRIADILEDRGEFDLAADRVGEAIAAAGGKVDADLHERHGDLLARAGRREQAIDAFQTVRRIAPQRRDLGDRIAELERLEDRGASDAAKVESRYEILGELGRGAMGIVYKARDRNLGRIVALKCLPDSLKEHPTAVALFKREAQAAAALNHRNIVTLFDAGEENGVYFITMELLEGMPLSRILAKRKRLSVADTARIGSQIAEGLQYAKERRIVHRDIKSGNLFFTTDRTVKIMDFGLAKTIEEVRRTSTMIGGTPNFMAPEQAAGGEIDHRADLYAFGVTLYQLVTGTVPFEDGDLAYHHRHTAPPDPRTRVDGLPDEFAELILRMLAKAPADRPADASEVGRALAAILEAQTARR